MSVGLLLRVVQPSLQLRLRMYSMAYFVNFMFIHLKFELGSSVNSNCNLVENQEKLTGSRFDLISFCLVTVPYSPIIF